ncbi:MAG: DUF1292 domain-containing protein [Erysipelotrichaceae bacterium]|nr:DUF1292 domain-containing protein [Erysipelotrichaceae bacterium]
MSEPNTFYIEQNGTKIKANILTNFEIYGSNYCIYTTSDKTEKNYNVYCAKIVGNNLAQIEKEEELKLTNKIVKELINSVKESKEEVE